MGVVESGLGVNLRSKSPVIPSLDAAIFFSKVLNPFLCILVDGFYNTVSFIAPRL